MMDSKNTKARARDEFLESNEGKRLINLGCRSGESSLQYSRNRIAAVWCAGWEAHEYFTHKATEGETND